jgi:hypothetical protein
MPMSTALARRTLPTYGGLGPRYERHQPIARVGGLSDWRDRFRLRASPNRPPLSPNEKLKRTAKVVSRSLLIGATSYYFGHQHGRKGAKTVLPFPRDLATAAAAHVAGLGLLATRFDKLAPALHAIGDGALGAHMALSGLGRGKAARAKAGEPPLLEGAYEAPAAQAGLGSASLSDEELASIARVAA